MKNKKVPIEDGYKRWITSYCGIYIEDPNKIPSSRKSTGGWPSSDSRFNIAVIAAAIS